MGVTHESIAQKIKVSITEALERLSIPVAEFSVEHPEDYGHGDYSTNIAMVLAKKVGKNPRDLAESIVAEIQKDAPQYIERLEVAGAGFINFFLTPEFFLSANKEILDEKSQYGKNNSLKDQKIIIEYTVTNVLKPMHIGHLMGNVIGESLSRIIESSGAEIKRNNYQGDTGLHIAKAVWGIQKLGGIKEGTLLEKSNYIGEAYALGSLSYEDDPISVEEIKIINKKLFEKSDSELEKLYQWGREISLEHFEVLYKKLGTTFDYYFFESEVAKDALLIIDEFVKKGVFENSEGAVVFRGEIRDPKLHTRVFVNNQNLPTYEAKDIAHAIRKYQIYPFDTAYILTANEQNEYFKVVLCALSEVRKDVGDKTHHLSHGLLKLPTGKMSSRKGNVITGEALIKQVEELVEQKIADRGFDEEKKKEVSNAVAIAAIKYSILRQGIGGDVTFDIDQALSFEGDSGPYLQYTNARINSLIDKGATLDIYPQFSSIDPQSNLEKALYKFPEVVKRANVELAPHHIVTYLIEVAGLFNSFYGNHIILDETDKIISCHRLAVAQAVSVILQNGLGLLGITAPSKM